MDGSSEFPSKARILVVGAGAIGGLLGVRLSQRGHTVTFLARGAHLRAMQSAGALRLQSPEGEESASAAGSRFIGSLCELEGSAPQDVVILGLKTHQIVAVLGDLHHAVGASGSGSRTVILTTQNGIPWWYFQGYSGPRGAELRDRAIEAVDPGGALLRGIDATRVLASVVYPAARVSAPGLIVHESGVRFPLGAVVDDGAGCGARGAQWVAGLLVDAGFKAPVLEDVRAELWLKAWGTVAVNPLSALTHAPLDRLCAAGGPGRDVVEGVMREVQAVAAGLGATMRVPLERRVEGARKVGAHKTSMLQDVEAGREHELETIVGAVVELGRLARVSTPRLDTVYGTMRMLDEMVRRDGGKRRARVVVVDDEE